MAQPVVAAVLFAATGLTPVEAESPNADRIADLYWFVSFWAALVLLVAVPLTIFVSAIGAGDAPAQIEGRRSTVQQAGDPRGRSSQS